MSVIHFTLQISIVVSVMSLQVILKLTLHQPFIDEARSCTHIPAAEHTPETLIVDSGARRRKAPERPRILVWRLMN